jgi:DNA replication and repair protein RecF
MLVKALSLTDFRSYPQVELSLDPGVNVLLGRNGQGKTNLVEAIGYLATLSSHRVATDAPLVRTDAQMAIIRLELQADGRTTLIELAIEPGKAKRARINRSPTPRASAILGLAQVVTFAPEDLALVKGDPTDRRRFLDDLLIQRRPLMASVRADYERVLKQRNALLRSTSTARRAPMEQIERTLSVWDEQLADHGAALTAARVALVGELRQPAADAYARISDEVSGHLVVGYESAVERWLPGPPADENLPSHVGLWREALLAAIADRRRDELDRGVTLVGPQRDDLSLRLGEQPARGYASHGESWSVSLALRLACFQVLRAEGEDPILILDDVFAELDARRRERLVSMIKDAEQVIITAAVGEDVPEGLDGRRFHVSRGTVIGEVA